MSSEALVKVAEGKIPIRNVNDSKELRHLINLNAQWLCEIEEKISKLEAKLNASQ